jgi:hypothetical protein
MENMNLLELERPKIHCCSQLAVLERDHSKSVRIGDMIGRGSSGPPEVLSFYHGNHRNLMKPFQKCVPKQSTVVINRMNVASNHIRTS